MAYGYPPVPPPQRRKDGLSAWAVTLIVAGSFGVLVLLASLAALMGARDQASHVREAQHDATPAATAPAATHNPDDPDGYTPMFDAADHAPPLAPADTCHGISTGSLKEQCKELVRSRLTAPLTAKFPGFLSDPPVTTSSDCIQVYSTWVKAKNAYGVPYEYNFVCTYDPKVGRVELTALE